MRCRLVSDIMWVKPLMQRLGLMQTQRTAEATHLAAAVLELERRLRSCAMAAQWRQPVCTTDGTMQVSAAAPSVLRPRERQQRPSAPPGEHAALFPFSAMQNAGLALSGVQLEKQIHALVRDRNACVGEGQGCMRW